MEGRGMNIQIDTRRAVTRGGGHSRRNLAQAFGIITAMLFFSAGAALRAQDQGGSKTSGSGQQHSGIGFSLSKDASAKDVGLPWYPGAKESKETPDDSPSVQFG